MPRWVKCLHRWACLLLRKEAWRNWLRYAYIPKGTFFKRPRPVPAWQPAEPLEPRLLLSATIEGRVFNDLNNNGAFDGTDSGLSDWIVYIEDSANPNGQLDQGELSAITDQNGNYVLTINDNFDTYDVRVQMPNGVTSPGALASSFTIDDEGEYTLDYAAPTPGVIFFDGGPKEGVSAAFAGWFTSQPFGPLTASIDWGDGSPVDEIGPFSNDAISPYHTYADTGEYDVTLTLTNAWGGTLVESTVIEVDDVLPVIEVTTRSSVVNVNTAFTIDIWAKTPATEKFSWWEVDWGDGTVEEYSITGEPVESYSVNHEYTEYGTYTMKVRGQDNEGNFTSTVTNVVPVLDTGFGAHGRITTQLTDDDDRAHDVAIQPDGKILAAGYATLAYGNTDFALVRYNSNGTLDTSFGDDGWVTTDFEGGYDEAHSVLVLPDGRILVAGYATVGPGNADFALARYNSNGTLDTSFDGDGKITVDFLDGDDYAYDMALDFDEQGNFSGIILVGQADTGSTSAFGIVKLTPDGMLDQTFDNDGKLVLDLSGNPDVAYGVAVQPDRKIVVVGKTGADSGVARLDPDGTPDQDFDAGQDADGVLNLDIGSAYDVALHSYGGDIKIVIASMATARFGLVRLNSDGAFDESFSGDGKLITDFDVHIDDADYPTSVLVQPDGKIVIGGYTHKYITYDNRPYDFALARVDAQGVLDPTFGYGGKLTTDFSYDDRLYALALQPNGKIVAVGHMGVPISPGSVTLQYNFAVARFMPSNGVEVVNPPPLAVGDSYATVAGQQLIVNGVDIPGVLANDSDPNNEPLTAALVMGSGPEHDPDFTLNLDGTFTYVPESGFFGIDYFTYKVSDGTSESQPVTVSIDVASNDTTPPELDQNNLEDLAVSQGQSAVITNANLLATDDGSTDSTLKFVITVAPEFGQILRNGVVLEVGDIFTQADINNQIVVYRHLGEAASMDGFNFIIRDRWGNESTQEYALSVDVTVTENRLPVLLTQIDEGETVDARWAYEGTAVLIRPQDLLTVDPDTSPARLIYTVTAPLQGEALEYGKLQLYDPDQPELDFWVDLGVGATFTQADVDFGRLIYRYTYWDNISGGNPLDDQVWLSVSDLDEEGAVRPSPVDPFMLRFKIDAVDRTLIVTTLEDQAVTAEEGPDLTDGLSLREALWSMAYQDRGDDPLGENYLKSVIVFDPLLLVGGGATMHLTEGELVYQSRGVLGADYNDLVVGPGSNFLTIDLEGKHRALHAKWADDIYQNLTIEGMTIANGYASVDGGAIYVESGYDTTPNDLTIRDLVVTDSRAGGYGGGIYVGPRVLPRLYSTVLRNNSAGADGGGAYFNLENAEVEDSWIESNSATNGGGLFLEWEPDDPEEVELGGGLDIYTSSIVNNTAVNDGGGVYVTGTEVGGGSSWSAVTISGNQAGGSGGGAFVESALIDYSTIVNNTAGLIAGGIYYGSGSWQFDASIVALNTAGDYSDYYAAFAPTNSLVGIWELGELPVGEGYDPDLFGSLVSPLDPLLTELVYYPPAARPLHFPKLGSPAIDKLDGQVGNGGTPYRHDSQGNPISFEVRDGDGIPYDVQTNNRGEKDLGAAEYQYPNLDNVEVRIDDYPIFPDPASTNYLRVNAGHDEGNVGLDGLPAPDNAPDIVAGHRIESSDIDLTSATLTVKVPDGGSWWMDYDSRLMLWWDPEGDGNWDPLESGAVHAYQTDVELAYDLIVEAIDTSFEPDDMAITVYVTSDFPYYIPYSVQNVRFTSSGVDLDIDSGNSRLTQLPMRDNLEESWETQVEHAKRVLVGSESEKLVPVVLEMLPGFDYSQAKLRFTNPRPGGSSGTLELWTKKDDRDPASVAAGGDFIPMGDILDASYFEAPVVPGAPPVLKPTITLWVEATAVEAASTIRVEVDPDGSSGFVFDDWVYVVPSDPVAFISGHVWNDADKDGERELVPIGVIHEGLPTNIVYVLDISGSTEDPYGSAVGDRNNDGLSNTILDAEISALITTTRNLQRQLVGWENKPPITVSIVGLSSQSVFVDLNPDPDTTLYHIDLADPSSFGFIEYALTERRSDGGTNYERGLQKTLEAFAEIDPDNESGHLVLFVSDGKPYPDNGQWSDELAAIKDPNGVNAMFRTYGVGATANVQRLKQEFGAAFDPSNVSSLIDTTALPVLGFADDGLSQRRVYIDLNGNDQYDPGGEFPEPMALTDSDGNYILQLDDVDPELTYTVRVVPGVGWSYTWPSDDPSQAEYNVSFAQQQEHSDIDFGLVEVPVEIDLDVDSDNNNGLIAPDRSEAEEGLEDVGGQAKVVLVNADAFTPIVLDLSDVDLSNPSAVNLQWFFSDAGPAGEDETGYVRLWRSNGGQDLDDQIFSGVIYSAESLGFSAGNNVVTFYVQGVNPTSESTHGKITAALLSPVDLTRAAAFDTVHVSVMDIPQGVGSVSGHVFHDRNRNAIWDTGLIQGEQPHIVFLVDMSGSTWWYKFVGEVDVGDYGEEGPSYTWGVRPTDTYNFVSDAEIAGVELMLGQLIRADMGLTAQVSVVLHDDTYKILDMDPVTPGVQYVAYASQDRDANDTLDVIDSFKEAFRYGPNDFRVAYEGAIEVLKSAGTEPGNATIIFMSDGEDSHPFEDQLQRLRDEWDANIRAFGVVGENSTAKQHVDMSTLRRMDPAALRVTSTGQLLSVFGGLGDGEEPEQGLEGWLVYLDLNHSGQFDQGDLSTTTDESGAFYFDAVPAVGEPLTVRIDKRPDDEWLLTAPQDPDSEDLSTTDHFTVMLSDGRSIEDLNFGLVEDVPPPTLEGADFSESTINEGDTVTITLVNPRGYEGFDPQNPIPLRYSFDVNDNGNFSDPEDVYRSADPYHAFSILDDYDPNDPSSPIKYVRIKIHDAAGNITEQRIAVNVVVQNVAPQVSILGLPDELDVSPYLPANIDWTTIPVTVQIRDDGLLDMEQGIEYSWWITRNGELLPSQPASYTVDPDDTHYNEGSGITEYNTPLQFTFWPSVIFGQGAPGEYVITVRATDKDGGVTEVPHTVTVLNPHPWGTQWPTAVLSEDGHTVTLSVMADDDKGEANLRYQWFMWYPSLPPGRDVPSRVVSHEASTYEVQIGWADNYWFRVLVMDADGHTRFSPGVEVIIDQIPSGIRIGGISDPAESLVVAAQLIDQFGSPMDTGLGPDVEVQWQYDDSDLQVQEQGTFVVNQQDGSATYTQAEEILTGGAIAFYATRVVEGVEFTAQMVAYLTPPEISTKPLFGAAANDITVVEGRPGNEDILTPMAFFVDLDEDNELEEYTVTASDWRDGNDDPDEPLFVEDLEFVIEPDDGSSSNQFKVYVKNLVYLTEGVRKVDLQITHTDLSFGLVRPFRVDDVEVTVISAPVHFVGDDVVAVRDVPLQAALLGTLRDDNPYSDPIEDEFTAIIHWGDGSDTTAVAAVPVEGSDGTYRIYTPADQYETHTYTSTGSYDITLTLKEDGVIVGTGSIRVTVQSVSVPVPALQAVFGGSQNSALVFWDKPPLEDDIDGWVVRTKDLNSGVVSYFGPTSGSPFMVLDHPSTLHADILRAPALEGDFIGGRIGNLAPDTDIEFRVQAVRNVEGNLVLSALSEPVIFNNRSGRLRIPSYAPGFVVTNHVPMKVTDPLDQVAESALVAMFEDDTNPDPSEFTATVDWSDGTSSDAVVEGSDGVYYVYADHTYHTNNNRDQYLLVVTVQKGQEAPMQAAVQTLVQNYWVPTPTVANPVALSSEEIFVSWAIDPQIDGYVIWATDVETGITRRIPSDETTYLGVKIVIAGTSYPALPTWGNYYYRVDGGLLPGTTMEYSIQAVRAYAGYDINSPISKQVRATTPDYNADAPEYVRAEHVIAEDTLTQSLVEGIQLFWLGSADLEGYRVFRQVDPDPETPGDEVWLDLIGGQTVEFGQWIEALGLPPSGDPILTDFIDPTDVSDNGHIGWFDAFDDEAGFNFEGTVQEYRYVVVAYESTPIGGIDVITNAAATEEIIVSPNSDPPSTPTGLTAASYHDAIQLTWDDRPVSDDADWNGWNVYRWNDSANPPTEEDKANIDPEKWTLLNLRPITVELGFNDRNAEEQVVNYYMVRSIDFFDNESDPAFTQAYRALFGLPPTPTSVFARSNGAAGGVGHILLEWDEVVPPAEHVQLHPADAVSHYEVEWTLFDDVDWNSPLGSATTPGTQLPIDGLEFNTQYRFRVRAIDQDDPDGEGSRTGDYSAWSTVVVASTGDGVGPANGPVLVSQEHLGPNAIKIVWTAPEDVDNPTAGFVIYRAKGSSQGNFIRLATTLESGPSGEFILADTGLSVSTTYHYRIYTMDVDGDLSPVLEIQQATDTVPQAPPFAAITSHAGDNPVELATDTIVRGVVDDANDTGLQWRLLLRPLSPSGSTDILIAESTQEVGEEGIADGQLGVIRPTMLQVGLYRLVLVAEETEGTDPKTTTVEGGLIQIRTEVKLGSLNLPFEDLVIDVPGGSPIVITRVYDSTRADELGDFGYGWFLQLTDTNHRTTARPGNFSRNGGLPALRDGDLVYFDVPGLGRQTFMFLGVPIGYKADTPAEQAAMQILMQFGAVRYEPAFIAVDGSGSRVEVSDTSETGELLKLNDEYYVNTLTGYSQIGYNPADPRLGGSETYTLITRDGRRYEVSAESGGLIQSQDANGNVTRYNGDSVTTDIPRYTIHRENGLIASITWISDGPNNTDNQIVYTYDSGQLVSFTDAVGQDTKFEYDSSTGKLTTITDPRGVEVLVAEYDAATGRLVRLQDATSNGADVNYGGFDGETGSNAVTDSHGNTVEQIFDHRGNVIREIVTLKDDQGVVTGYKVTVHEYVYNDADDSHILYKFKVSNINTLEQETHWQPFSIEAPDPTGLRYSSPPSVILNEILYKSFAPGDPDAPRDAALKDHDLWQPQASATLAPDGAKMLTTWYENYYLGKPGKITDPYGNVTLNYYDSAGNLRATTDPSGQTTYFRYSGGSTDLIPNNQLPENGGLISGGRFSWEQRVTSNVNGYVLEQYFYVNDHNRTSPYYYQGLPAGLLLETYRILDDGSPQVLSRNVYHGDDALPGLRGRLKSTTDAAGITTRYTYDNLGRVKDVHREWTDAAGQHSVLQSHTEYDAAGRVILTTDAQGNTTRTFYDRLGRTLVTIDAYGGRTVNTYDVRGQLIRTLTPDGFETRTVYDAQGRVIFQSEPFFSNSTYTWNENDLDVTWDTNDDSSTYIVTQTIHDSQGQVTRAKRYENAQITLTVDGPQPNEGVLYVTVAVVDEDNLLYEASTYYDIQGRVVESVSPDGLRTGTVYYPNGQVRYTGVVKDVDDQGQPIGPGEAADPQDFISYTEHRYAHSFTITTDAKLNDHVEDGDYTISLEQSFQVRELITFSASDTTLSELLQGLADAVNNATGAFTDQVTASVQGGQLVILADSPDPDFTFRVVFAMPEAEEMVVQLASAPTQWVRDANGNVTITVNGLQLAQRDRAGKLVVLATRDLTIYTDGSFTETLTGLPGKLVTRDDLIIPDALESAFDGDLRDIGRMVVRIDQHAPGTSGGVTYELYDKAGRLIDVWLPRLAANVDGSRYQYTYDVQGNQTRIKDPLGRVTMFTYDDFGRQLTRTLPLGQVERNFRGTMSIADVQSDPITSGSSVAAGQLAFQLDFEGNVTQYFYDNTTEGRARLVEKIHYAAADLTTPVTAGMTLAQVVTALAGVTAQRSVAYSYDAQGRQSEVEDSAHGLTTYQYDDQGRVAQIASPEGIVNHRYDALGRLIRTFTGSGESTANPDFPDDPVAHWELNETTGTTAEDSAGDNDGTLNGDPVWVSEGYIDGALDFDGGTNDYVKIPYFISGNIPFTVAAWVQVDATGNQVVVTQGSRRLLSIITDSGNVRLQTNISPGSNFNSDATFTVGEGVWHHVAVIYDGATLRFYIDGVADSATLSDSTLSLPTQNVRIGANASGSAVFKGSIDDVRMYNRALSTVEIDALATGSPTSEGDVTTDTRYTYDNQGRLETVAVHRREGADLPVPEATTYHYDLVGNLDFTEQSNGVIVDYTYDSLNRLTTLRHFVDHPTSGTPLFYDDGIDALVAEFLYTLDARGNRTESAEFIDADNDALREAEEQRTFSWAYDALNRLVEEIHDYKSDGSPDADDYVHKYFYDAASNRKLLEKYSGALTVSSEGRDEWITYAYDANDRLLVEESRHPSGDSILLADSSGNGHDVPAAEIAFNPDHAPSPAGGEFSLAFDGIDQLVNLSDGTGMLTHDAFTARTIAFHFKAASGGAAVQTLYEEGDAAGGGLAVRLDDGKLKVRFVSGGSTLELWELHGQPPTFYYEDFINLPDPTDTWHHLTLVFGDVYTGDVVLYLDGVAVANVAVMTLGGEFATLGTMQQRQGDAGLGATVGSDAYGDSSPNLFKGLIDDVRIYDVALWSDNITRLAEGLEPTSQGSGNPPPPPPAPIAHWSMEPVDGPSPDDRRTVYEYGPSNAGTKQTAKSVYAGPDYVGAFDLLETHTYEYDPAGRMTTVTITKDGTTVVEEYGYNGQNLRVSRAVTESGNTTTTEYLLDLRNPTGYSQILEEYEDSAWSKTYTLGHDVISQHDTTNGVLTLLYDGHGSTRALLNASGQIVAGQVFAYDAYGNVLTGAGLTGAADALTNLLYSGEHFNALTQLQNLRARWYNPSSGRFLSLDPYAGNASDPVSLHKYLYAHANPVMGIDPSGRNFNLVEFAFGTSVVRQIIGISGLVGVTTALWSYISYNTFFVGDLLTAAQQENVNRAIGFIRSVGGYETWADRAAQMTYKVNPNEHWGQTRPSLRTVWLSERALRLDYRLLAGIVLHENVHGKQWIWSLRGLTGETEAYQVQSGFMHKAGLNGTVEEIFARIGSQSNDDLAWLFDQAYSFIQYQVENPAVLEK